MTIGDKIRDGKLQYNINREAAKTSALSSDNIDTYEYLTVEEILPSNQIQIIEQAKFTYSSLAKAFEKQRKTIENAAKNTSKDFTNHKHRSIINHNQLFIFKSFFNCKS